MAKAIFTKPFNYTSRKRNAGWSIKPDAAPQTFPEEVITAAVAAGCAEIVAPKRSGKAANGPETPEAG